MSRFTPARIVTLSAAVLAVVLLLATGNTVVAQESYEGVVGCDGAGCGGEEAVYGGGGMECCDQRSICQRIHDRLRGCLGSRDYVWPNYCGMMAPQYPVPYDVPHLVGRTEFTYPPVMPHHSLPHFRTTYAYRHGPGMARTTVKWRPSLGDQLKRVHKVFELPR